MDKQNLIILICIVLLIIIGIVMFNSRENLENDKNNQIVTSDNIEYDIKYNESTLMYEFYNKDNELIYSTDDEEKYEFLKENPEYVLVEKTNLETNGENPDIFLESSLVEDLY